MWILFGKLLGCEPPCALYNEFVCPEYHNYITLPTNLIVW